MDEQLKNRIQEIVDGNRVVLFMKGNRDMPQCGFSMRAVQIVNALGVEFATVDVLLEEGVHVTSNLVDVAPDDIEIGLPVEVVFERVNDDVTLPLFRRGGKGT